MIAGIDPSTRTGLVVLDPQSGTVVYRGEVTGGKDTAASKISRAMTIADNVIATLLAHCVTYAVVESHAYAVKFVSYDAVYVNTLIQAGLLEVNIPYKLVAPTSLKKFVCGGAYKIGKKEMAICAKDRWDFTGTDNEVDAYGLALMGLEIEK